MLEIIPQIILSLSPVLLFLAGLLFLDSFKLVKFRAILIAIGVGGLSAIASLMVNTALVDALPLDGRYYPRYIAPVVEESLKAVFLVYLIRTKKVGFMVDAALFGFAIGAGFALVENIVYLRSMPHASLFVWAIRGFGTAVMHGGTTAIFAVLAKNRSDVKSSEALHVFLPGLLVAMVVHSFFNHFFLPPEFMTIVILIILPAVLLLVFKQSEQSTREWLGVGLDTDVELLRLITEGGVSNTKIGTYLRSLESRFRGEVLADMLCYLRVHLELSVKAKALLLMRSAGFDPPPDPEVEAQLNELRYLERSIGQTGKLLMKPFVRLTSRDLWQLHMLTQK
ncbi:MAG TPA: PrsW family glutamic-type intramembrane protease [Bacteroidota bacterium]|nr:PrsW family glutamic-type intramembrane protease [Bacteroidota bacterium]